MLILTDTIIGSNPMKKNSRIKNRKKLSLKIIANIFSCFLLIFPAYLWAAACSDHFSNGIQATSPTGNINLSFQSIITGGGAILRTTTLTDNSTWAACSGSNCVPSGSAALTSAPTFLTGTASNGNINVPFNGSANVTSGDYGTVSVAQQGTLRFNDSNGLYRTRAVTTGFRSELALRSGDYWINGNLTLGQETILRRLTPSAGSTRIFVNGNVNMAFRVSTANFSSSQLLIYATGTITSANEVNLSAFIYGGGNVSFGFRSVINGAISGNNFTATGNEVRVNYQPSALTTANFSPFCSGAAATVDHYELQISNSGLACLGADVTVRACANSLSPCTIATTTSSNVNLATSAGTLDATTLILVSGTAATKLKNPSATNGSTATVTLSGETTPALSLRKCCTSTSSCVVANSCSITFNTAGLIFANNATTLGDIPTEIAGVTDSLVYLRAIQSNTSTGACTADFTSAQNVLLAYQCRNPTTCIAGQTLTLNGSPIQSNANSAATISYSTVSLNFNSQGTAAIPLNYSDVGQIRLHASLTRPATSTNPAYTLVGTSNDFVVKPYTLVVQSALTASNGANPGGTNAAGTAAGFVAAGAAFQVKVEARKSPGTASTDITPNFGREVLSEVDITLSAVSLMYPTGGALSPLSGTASFTATTPTGTWVNTDVIWDQVGSITIQPEFTDGDYLGAGNIAVLSPSGTIGRFYPDHYTLSSSTVTNGCGTFSYMSQPNINFSYQLLAQGLSGSTLTNYGGNYATASTIAAPNYVAENADGGNGGSLSARVSAGTSPVWANGVLSLSSAVASFNRQTTNSAPDGPFASLQWGVNITDTFDVRSLQGNDINAATTGVCTGAGCTAASLGLPLTLRYGRLRLDDAFGPETVALPVNFVTEYWTGNYFALNASDSCTIIPRAAVTYPAGSLTLDANRTVNLSSGTTQGIYNNIDATGIYFNAGTAGHYFSKPSAGGTGGFIVGIDLTSLSWLRYDWNQDGNYSDTTIPNARFSFGSYRGNDRIIYWREKLQ